MSTNPKITFGLPRGEMKELAEAAEGLHMTPERFARWLVRYHMKHGVIIRPDPEPPAICDGAERGPVSAAEKGGIFL